MAPSSQRSFPLRIFPVAMNSHRVQQTWIASTDRMGTGKQSDEFREASIATQKTPEC